MRGRMSIIEDLLSYNKIRNRTITDEDKIYLSEVVEYAFRKLSFYNQKMYNDYINPDIPLIDLKNIYGNLVERKAGLIINTIGEILVKIGVLSYVYDHKFSIYKLCLNFDDPRSKLFFEYVRILKEIREVNPDVKFLLENVEMKKEWTAVINEHLGVKGYSINSKLLSAHNRPRMYWTNIDFKKPIDDAGVKLLDILEDVDTTGFINHDGILFDPRIREDCRNLVSVVNGEVRISQATKLGYIVAESGDGVNLDFPTSKSRRGRVIKGKSACLTTSTEPLVFVNGAIRWLTVTEKERLQTLPDGYTEGVSYTARVEGLGNGWTADVITHIFRGLRK